MKKDFLTLVLAAFAFVFITNTMKAQTIQTHTKTKIWQLMGGTQTLEMVEDSMCVFRFHNDKYTHISDYGYLWFDDYQEMTTFFNKVQEMAELPKPKGNDKYTMDWGKDVLVMRGKNMLGVPYFIITVENKYFLWDGNKNKQVLAKI